MKTVVKGITEFLHECPSECIMEECLLISHQIEETDAGLDRPLYL